MAPVKHKARPGSSRRRAKQKTSTPSKSRIECYMSPGNISKITGSPSHLENLDLGSSTVDSDGHGRLSGVNGQRSSGSSDGAETNRIKSQKSQRMERNRNVNKSVESTMSSAGEEDSPNKTVRKRINVAVSRKSSKAGESSTSRKKGSDKSRQTSSLSTATIDKFMSPDSSNRLVSTPTRFPRGSRVDDMSDEDEDDDEDDDADDDDDDAPKSSHTKDEVNSQLRRKHKGSRKGKQQKSRGTSSLSADDDKVPRYHHGSTQADYRENKPNSKGAKRKSSDSVPTSASKKQKARRKGDISEDDEVTSDEEVSIQNIKASTNFMASGDVKTHMSDKEFLASQVHTMSKPFSMDAGPSQWMQVWKARESYVFEDDESDELPERVIHKATAKLNTAMSSELGRSLSRHNQRKVLMKLDEIRGQEQKTRTQGGVEKLRGSLRIGASLDEILQHYPCEWPAAGNGDGSTSEQMDELSDRYAEVRARLTTISQQLAVKEAEHKHMQELHDQLKEIDSNLNSCTDTEFKEELYRTKSLVAQILKRLNKRRSPRKQKPTTAKRSLDGEKSGSDMYQNMIRNHKSLVQQLFDGAT